MTSRTAPRTAEWHRSATRWIQIAFVENDPVAIDLSFWEEVIDRTRANAVCLSAGGYVAYYPTDIPFHHRSVHLAGGDLFGAFVDLARRRGIHVMARVDPHAIHSEAARAHPEWLARDRDGNPISHPSLRDQAWLTCPFSTYHSEFLTSVIQEVVRTYDVDAVFANRWAGGPLSYSAAAQDGFRSATGLSLPATEDDSSDPSWPAYEAWRRDRLSDLIETWSRAVRDISPHSAFLASLGGPHPISYFDRDLVEATYPFFVLDK